MKAGEALQKKRHEKRLSQSMLAHMAGISIATLRSYEQGIRDINKASAETVVLLAKWLECSPEEIMNSNETW